MYSTLNDKVSWGEGNGTWALLLTATGGGVMYAVTGTMKKVTDSRATNYCIRVLDDVYVINLNCGVRLTVVES